MMSYTVILKQSEESRCLGDTTTVTKLKLESDPPTPLELFTIPIQMSRALPVCSNSPGTVYGASEQLSRTQSGSAAVEGTRHQRIAGRLDL